ncbi:uncharacterized protein [Drosophila tropicalis]|uniref:uncharacterized protein n=1 Tax=Drosophila tropicalis TaxID=46794 RepID=UPI0035AC2721
MSSMKGGFSTINRWFGRKKDKSSAAQTASMGKLSKSTTQLHHLSTSTDINSINEASQLEYNRITPIPAATSNAPFEQTFRITVLLPNNQLFVTRLGARVQLSKLLSLVCDHKQLDSEKYEFRSPVDASQVYSCESTIGAVGLSEIRLCLKSESYDSFNADSLPKFHRTGAARDRDSLSSSSDFSSSRNSKITAKTPSPYSSSNSLNSMDSTGMNYTRTPVVVPNKVMAPPPRKKRAAPRPPSQVVIPEQSVPDLTREKNPEPAYAVIVKRPQLCMSTPNLSAELDCNGNSPDASDGHYATLELKPEVVGVGIGGPEPSPRKRLLQIKKKTTAPAPPPDAGAMSADSISLASTTASITETAPMPQPAPRISTPQTPQTPQTPLTPPPLPASTAPAIPASNVSKVILNRTPTPEPRSLGSAADDDDNDAASKQADSGIGEPAPSPEPETETKSQLESSSEDEEAIKVYNFKLCQTSVKGDPMPTTLAELAVLTAAAAEEEEEEEEVENGQLDEQENAVTTNGISEQTSLSSWNYSVPISPPPDFSDQRPKGLSSAASSPSTPHNVILDELSTIIQQQRLDTLIRKQPEVQEEIESAKPNRLANFTIASISSSSSSSSNTTTTTHISTTATTTTKITRADSFQATGTGNDSVGSLSLRSSSHLSLNKVDVMPNGGLNQRRSSSELSIGEAPSLQSLEVIKTILNSRKNSLADSSSIKSGSSASSSPQLEKPKNCIPNGEQVEQVDAFIPPIKEQSSPPKQDSPPITPVKEQSTKSATAVNIVSPGKPPIKPLKDQMSPTNEQSSPTSVAVETVKEPVNEVIQVKEQIKPDSPVIRQTNVVAPPKEQSSPAPAASPKPVKVETNHIVTTREKSPVSTEARSRQAQVSTLKLTTSIESNDSAPAPATAPITVKTQVAAQPSEKSKPEATTKTEAKPLPPTYRYSGPPSINFATWSERPKSQVAIKNEGDYIFGGSSSSTSTSNSNKLTIEVASPILRMGISQRKDYHVPITVKPLTDSSDAKEGQENEVPVQSQSSTLPRPSKSNRFTLPNLNQAPTSITKMSIPSSNTNSLPRPKSVLVESAPAQATASTPAPFGQNTLRRTGFKERMLAKEQQEKEQALSVRVSVNGGATSESSVALHTTTATATASASAPASAPSPVFAPARTPATAPTPAPKPVPAAKSITLLKSTKSVELKVKEPEPEPVILQVKLRPTTQPAAAIKVTSSPNPPAAAIKVTTSPNPPSPPLPPAPPKQLKLNGGVRTTKVVTPTSPDPRSQLLEAIRNFKRDELNRA